MIKITIVGSGAFGTAMGHSLAFNDNNEITLLSIDVEEVEEINRNHTNKRYFPNRSINDKVIATLNLGCLSTADIIMVCIPSKEVGGFINKNKEYFSDNVLVVNLAKGLSKSGEIITSFLQKELITNNIVTLKGPTFASELISGTPSLLTLGFEKDEHYEIINRVLQKTNINIDLTTDIVGVEYLSVLKNIYSIIIGYVDAKYNSSNTQFMIFTKAFKEISILLKELGGKEDTLLKSCGIGDLGLTSLNDLSRNRTLGLLIGKGFFNKESVNNSVVLEGVNSINYIANIINEEIINKLPLFMELRDYFTENNSNENININFKTLFNQTNITVLTYGTFDLLHYGHIEILKRSKALGTKLIVGVSSDDFNKGKGKESILPFVKRKELLESIDYVDVVIPEVNWEQKINDVQKYNVDIFVMGDDWKGKFDFLKKYCEVIYLPRTKSISTTKLKQILK